MSNLTKQEIERRISVLKQWKQNVIDTLKDISTLENSLLLKVEIEYFNEELKYYDKEIAYLEDLGKSFSERISEGKILN